MIAPKWTNEDEELWTRYATAALSGSRYGGSAYADDAAAWAARAADEALALHRERFPLPPKEGPFR